MGSIQFWNHGRIVRIDDIPDYVRRWHREWRENRHPTYGTPPIKENHE